MKPRESGCTLIEFLTFLCPAAGLVTGVIASARSGHLLCPLIGVVVGIVALVLWCLVTILPSLGIAFAAGRGARHVAVEWLAETLIALSLLAPVVAVLLTRRVLDALGIG